jgi:hypothetical protein
MSNDNKHFTTQSEHEGTHGRENPTPVTTLSKNPNKRG